ncbi:MAG: aldo/keto reductase, partial [Nitrososphaerales archaeon]
MEYVRLGKSDLRVSVIGLGAWQIGSAGWGWSFDFGEQEAVATINRALELGINLIDTAESYGNGLSEKMIGQEVKESREKFVVATKVSSSNLSYDDLLTAAEGSLTRLGIDFIDLYQVHWPNPSIPIRETMKAVEKLVRDGKVRYIGVSNFGTSDLMKAQEALSSHDIISNQVRYNLLQREIQDDLLPYARKEGVSVIAYSPLAQGVLTGKYNEYNKPRIGFRASDTIFSSHNMRAISNLIKSLAEIGKRRKVTV